MTHDSMNQATKDVRVLKGVLFLLAFSIPISISVAELAAFLSVACWLFLLRKKEFRTLAWSNPLLLPIALFVFVAIGVSFVWGVRPMRSLDKSHRLLFLLLAFMMEAGLKREKSVCTWKNVRWTAFAFITGCTLLGFYDLIRIPWYAYGGGEIYDAGNMRDPQFYMCALCLLIALWAYGVHREKRWLWALVLFANAAGLILHFKRGVWIAFCCSMLLIAIKTKRWKILIALVLCALALLLVPQVRERIARLKEVTEVQTGGRYVLWSDTAPALFKAYPYGMGWSCVTHDDMMEHSTYPVQEKLNHLHNNILQMRLEQGLPQ